MSQKKAVFVTVRSDSSRLPEKAYKTILGRPVIEMIILRAKIVKNADMVVVCTTERPVDDRIVGIAKNLGVRYFRGSLEDKLDRWYGAVKEFNIGIIATFDGDDLLCAPELIDKGLEQIEEEGLDFLKAPPDLAVGAFTYCIRASALEKVCSIKDTKYTEMMWIYFEDTGFFKVGELKITDNIYFNPDARLTLDYEEDFDFFETVFKYFNNIDNAVPLRAVMKYLYEHPAVVQINAGRQKEWRQNQINKTKLVLKNSDLYPETLAPKNFCHTDRF
jgi:spore coat polysaccharide biosynthesis protein SpsF (cytidylyltransferase family)